MVAAFAKKIARLSLSAPPNGLSPFINGSVWVTMLLLNVLSMSLLCRCYGGSGVREQSDQEAS